MDLRRAEPQYRHHGTGQGTTTLDHYPSGRIKTVTRPDSSTTATEYDASGRTKTITHAKAGSTLAAYAYRYDLNGNRIEQKRPTAVLRKPWLAPATTLID